MPVPTTVETPKTAKVGKFKATRSPLRHPYQNIMVPTDGSVLLAYDAWVDVQLAAKVIEKI